LASTSSARFRSRLVGYDREAEARRRSPPKLLFITGIKDVGKPLSGVLTEGDLYKLDILVRTP
jgi:hypothetical protein